MFRLAIYVLNGTAYIPTTGRIVGGPCLQTNPVCTASVNDSNDLRAAILRAMRLGNPILTPPFPKSPVVVQAMGLKSWSSLVRQSCGYFLAATDQGYSIHYARKALPKGENGAKVELPAGLDDDMAVADFLLERIRRDQISDGA